MRNLDYRPDIQYEVSDHEPIYNTQGHARETTYHDTVASPERIWNIVLSVNAKIQDIKNLIDKRLDGVLLSASTYDMEDIKSTYGDISEEGKLKYSTFKKLNEDSSDPRKKALLDSIMMHNNTLDGYTELDRYFITEDLTDELYNVVDFIKGTAFNLLDPSYSKSTADEIFDNNVLRVLEESERKLYASIQEKIKKKDELYKKTLKSKDASADYDRAIIDLYFEYDALKTIEDTKRIAISKLHSIKKEADNVYTGISKTSSQQFVSSPEDILSGIVSSENIAETIPSMNIMLESYYEKTPDDSVRNINKVKSLGSSIRDMVKDQAILYAQYRTKVVSNTMKWTYVTGGEDTSSDNPNSMSQHSTPFDEILDIIAEAGILAEKKYMKAMFDYEKITTLTGKARISYENSLIQKDKTKALYKAIEMVKAQQGSNEDLGAWARTITEIL
jgi:hypothetical protein